MRECAYESGFGFYLLAKVGAWGAFVLPRVLLIYFVRTLDGWAGTRQGSSVASRQEVAYARTRLAVKLERG